MTKFLLVLLLVLQVCISGSALAAPSVAVASTANTNRIINNIIRNTPGVTSYTTTGTGVMVNSAGAVVFVRKVWTPV